MTASNEKKALVSQADLVALAKLGPEQLQRSAQHLQYECKPSGQTAQSTVELRIPVGGEPGESGKHPKPEPAQPIAPEPLYWAVTKSTPVSNDPVGLGTAGSVEGEVAAVERPEPTRLSHQPLWSKDELSKLCQKLACRLNRSRQIDVAPVIRRLTRNEAVRRLPRRVINASNREVILLVDTSRYLSPVYEDFHQLTKALRRVFGSDLTRVIQLPEGPRGRSIEHRGEQTTLSPSIPDGARIICISDFGVAHPSADLYREQWAKAVKDLERGGCDISLVNTVQEKQKEAGDYVSALVSAMSCLLIPDRRRLRRLRIALLEAGVDCSVIEEIQAWNHEDKDPAYPDAWMMERSIRATWQQTFKKLPVQLRDPLQQAMRETRDSLSAEAACIELMIERSLGLTQELPPEQWLQKAFEWRDATDSRRTQAEQWLIHTNEALATAAGSFATHPTFSQLYSWNTQVMQANNIAPASGLTHATARENAEILYFFQQGRRLGVSSTSPSGHLPLAEMVAPCIDIATGKIIGPQTRFVGEKFTVRSHIDELTFEALRKPDWAGSMARTQVGMEASHESGITLEMPVSDTDSKVSRAETVGEQSQPESQYQLKPGQWHTKNDLSDWMSDAGADDKGLWAEFRVGHQVQRLRWIMPGEFLMGSPDDEADRYNDETQHRVRLTRGYWLADTACTQGLWEAVMGENPSRFKDEDRPVEQVSWDDVQRFLTRLNGLLPGLNAHLPTEAQWEYAARAGTTTPFWWGASLSTTQANYNGYHPYKEQVIGVYREETVAVKEFEANPWGLYQVHGNVDELCQDWYDDYTEQLAVDPAGPGSGVGRVCRGGSWSNSGWLLRSADRDHHSPGFEYDALGFRLAAGQFPAEPG